MTKNKKIAIISSSPLMMMLALKLQDQGNEVLIFDMNITKGGAWSWNEKYLKKKKLFVPKYTNIINPYSKREVKFTNKMNKFLKKNYKIKVNRTFKQFKINYNFEKKYIYDFSNFYSYGLSELNYVKKFVKKIEVLKNNKVKINRSIEVDKLFIPSFSGVREIKISKNKIFYPECKEITSEHISIIAKKFKLKNFFYSQFFDKFFDRVKIEKIKKFYVLTARLDHSIKGTKVSILRRNFLDKFVDKKDVIDVKLSKFHNYYRNKKQLLALKKAISGSNIKYVDTTQFMSGFYSLRGILNV